MASKIGSAMAAVQPGSSVSACVVASGADLHSIRAVLGSNPKYFSNCGTLFVTPGTQLEAQAKKDFQQVGSVSTVLVGRSEIIWWM